MNKKSICAVTIAALVLVGALSPFILRKLSPIEFNQFLIQRLKVSYGTASFEEIGDSIRSSYFQGLNVVLRKVSNNFIDKPDYEKPDDFFEYVFSWLPSYVIVFPTEKFYYYSFHLDGFREVAGNIRLADLYKGEFNIAYFPVDKSDTFKSLKFKDGEGVEIEKITDRLYDVTFKEKTVRFKFPEYAHLPSPITLLSEEKFIGRLFDESGTGLLIIYNTKTNAFYEVLDEERGVNDEFEPISDGFIVGKRTDFIYFNDEKYNRKIIVAVSDSNSKANNYLDGPGDQVPIDINFKEDLSRAYPSVLSGDGTDDYGVWLNKPEWQRFITGPFGFYNVPSEFVEERKNCLSNQSDRSVFWTCLTREWWNTPEWRKQTIERLIKEGKSDIVERLEI